MFKKHLEQHGIRTFGLNTDLMYRTEDVVIFTRTNSSSMEMTVMLIFGRQARCRRSLVIAPDAPVPCISSLIVLTCLKTACSDILRLCIRDVGKPGLTDSSCKGQVALVYGAPDTAWHDDGLLEKVA